MAIYSNSILMRKIKQYFLKFLFTGLTSVMAILLYLRVVGFVSPLLNSFTSQSTIENQLKNASLEVNKQCPVILDNETRLDSTNIGSNKSFIYFYTLTNQSIKAINVDGMKEYLTPQIINNVRTNEQMRFMKDNDITLVYKYFDKDNVHVFDIQVSKNDYN